MPRISSSHFIVLIAMIAIAGCGDGAGYPATEKVTGKVTYNGGAVAGATVSFSPEGGGNAAAGITDASGNFTLTTFQSGDGAVPGNYKVSVSKVEQSLVATPEVTADDPSAAYKAAEAAGEDVAGTGQSSAGGATANQGPKDLLPAKYASADTSDLKAAVTKGDKNNFEFKLQ